MDDDNVGRISLLGILGVIGAVAITKPELNGQTGVNEDIIRWLLYSLSCGLIINTQEAKRLSVISVAALVSAATLILTIAFKVFLTCGVLVSGVIINYETKPVFTSQLPGGLFVISTLAIIMASYSRGIVLSLLNNLFQMELIRAKKIEAILNKVVSIGAVAAVIIFRYCDNSQLTIVCTRTAKRAARSSLCIFPPVMQGFSR
jgi:hypothetical protein